MALEKKRPCLVKAFLVPKNDHVYSGVFTNRRCPVKKNTSICLLSFFHVDGVSVFHVVDQEVAKMRLQGEEINMVDIPLT